MQHNMSVQYETVKYATGFVNNINPKGFTDIHYDKSPSPLGVFGGGLTNSVFFQGGLVDAANAVATDLFNGNILGAVIKGGVIFNNTKDADLGRVLEKDLQRVVGSILRGNNPLSDIVLPNIFNTESNATGKPRSGTGAPVDRTVNTSNNISGAVSSNSSNIISSTFNNVGDFIAESFSLGNATTIPNTTSSPASSARLSDFSTSVTSSNTGSRNLRLTQINDRITNLQRQIQNEPANTVLITERNDLIQRRLLESGIST
jgi:hypothetical protein